MKALIFIAAIYVIISVLIAIIDLMALRRQEIELASFPIGDLEYDIKPARIFGLHNWIFLPSWVVILTVLGIINLANRVSD